MEKNNVIDLNAERRKRWVKALEKSREDGVARVVGQIGEEAAKVLEFKVKDE